MTGKDLSTLRLHLTGCGKMGSALLASWIAEGVKPRNVTIRTASAESAGRLTREMGVNASPTAGFTGADVVVLAVKPQMLDTVLAESWPTAPLYLSIAAGKGLEYLRARLGPDARIIRAMPNTPALVGKGMTTLVAAHNATPQDRAMAEALCRASGEAIWLESEAQLDIATAVAGSGPAYVFHFAEALVQSAVTLGMDEATALALVRATLRGSVALADAEGWGDLARLREDVTSKGGVTAAALAVLMPELPALMERALRANLERSKTLS